MTTNLKDNAKNMILGALVADAATLGLHWIYDQEHIRKIAPNQPEFTKPDPQNYIDVPGYFAHNSRTNGQQSQYGEQLLTLLRSLVECEGKYDEKHYKQLFRDHFGYGGAYIGYIDHATRETLDNFRRAEDETLKLAQSIPFDGDKIVTVPMIVKIQSAMKQYQGDELTIRLEEAIRITHDNDEVVAYGFKILEKLLSMKPVYGANDEQLPAISKLPALVASFAAMNVFDETKFFNAVTSATRVTSDHERSIDYGKTCAEMMLLAIRGADIKDLMKAVAGSASDEIKAHLGSLTNFKGASVPEVTKHYGMACDLKYGVPSVVHNVMNADSFEEAIRENIYAGGDSCGRSILLGALMGAHFGLGGDKGIPTEWAERLTDKEEINALISKLI